MIPVFNQRTFDRLAEETGSRAVAIDFLITFTSLLPARIERIRQTIQAGNEEATDALLSLQTTAAWAGAAQLQASATKALAQQQVGPAPADLLVRKLEKQADAFTEAFLDFHYNGYTSPPDTPTGATS